MPTSSKSEPTFQVMSDLYIYDPENAGGVKFTNSADYLILAGDIGKLKNYEQYRDFLAIQTARYRAVILVLGNHEFYGGTIQQGWKAAKRLEADSELDGKLIVLDKEKYDVPGTNITILGCTLWDVIDDYALALTQTQDHEQIRGFNHKSHNGLFIDDSSWLEHEVEKILRRNKKVDEKNIRQILVVTHHPPSFEVGDTFKTLFLCEELTHPWTKVHSWVYGHSHTYQHKNPSMEIKKSGVRFVSNQRGIPRCLDGGFDAEKVIEI